VGEEQKIASKQRGILEDFPGLAVFVPNSLGGMTGGTSTSVTEGRKEENSSGEKRNGPWAIFGIQAEVQPPTFSFF
jgi:hypothetical protein